MHFILKSIPVVVILGLTACSGNFPGMFGYSQGGREISNAPGEKGLAGTSVDAAGRETKVNVTMTGGGEIGVASMTADDKAKMARALDAGTGKSTQWQNGITGITYTVTPTKKVEIKGNPFCQEYNVVASKGSFSKSINDTACVTADGSWHTV